MLPAFFRPVLGGLLLALTSCAGTSGTGPAFSVTAPVSYTGTLPCADCPGIRHTLNLWPDNVYFERLEYLERERAFDAIGTWALSSDGRTLALRGDRTAPERYAVKSAGVLRRLDLESREVQSLLNYELTRAPSFRAFEPLLTMRGLYSYVADAGFFEECLTHRRFPVAQEGDNARLEAGYAKARHAPGAASMATVEGRIVTRPRTEGSGRRQMLVVERFIGFTPGAICGSTLKPR